MRSLVQRFQGTLLGLAVGDALGARFEGQSADWIIEALNSVPTAIAVFALFHDSYEQAVGNATLLGGDTDTIAAMTGALSGALLGIEGIPGKVLDMLEDQGKGRTYITELADKLHVKYLGR